MKSRRIQNKQLKEEIRRMQEEIKRMKKESYIKQENETKEVKIIENVNGQGNTSYRIGLPKKWVEELEIKEVLIEYNNKKKEIIIKKKV